MKRLLFCISILLLAVSCQKYDDTQIKKDISDLQEQVASLKAWCESSQAAVDAVAALKEAVGKINGIAYVEYFTGTYGKGYNIGLDDDQEITIYNVAVSGEDSFLGKVNISESSVEFILTDGTSVVLPRLDATIRFGTYEKQLVSVEDTVELILAPSVSKDTYAGIKAEIAGFDGEYVTVATKGGGTSWKIKALNPEFGADGQVTRNPGVVIVATPSNATDAILTVTLIDNAGNSHVTSAVLTSEDNYADLVVIGKIFTAESDIPVEAFAVKDGKYIYVGDAVTAKGYVKEGVTKVIDHTGKGLVMPSCGNGHAHYMIGYAFKKVGTMVGSEDTPEKFLNEIVPAAVKKARDNNSPVVFGFGWNQHYFKENMPTREQLDSICADLPMYFADEEAHKGLVNTAALVAAGIMDENGNVLKKDKDIRGGEIAMKDGKPSGLLLEQAGTYVRRALDNENLYSVATAAATLGDIENHLLAEGYTMYLDGWSSYFFNDHFYQAAKQIDDAGKMHFVLGLSHEIESWMTASDELAKATKSKDYASKHVLPQWIKLFIDGTVEGGTGYSAVPYPDGHEGIVNWNEQEVTDITSEANKNCGLSMHIHTMGDMAVKLAVDAFAAGGQDEKLNTVVHVRNVLPETLTKMAEHNVTVTSGMLWHQGPWYLPIGMYLMGMVPEGYEDMSYPMKSFFDYGINISSSTDYPALTGSPDSPFGVMGIAVSGMSNPSEQFVWWSQELISREQALKALTINCAKQMFIDQERGSIKEGKYADFLLVDKDVLSCDVNQIQYAKPAATFFEGEVVFPPSNPILI